MELDTLNQIKNLQIFKVSFMMQGDPKRSGTVLAAGVETCGQFMTIAPTAPPFLETQTTHLVSFLF